MTTKKTGTKKPVAKIPEPKLEKEVVEGLTIEPKEVVIKMKDIPNIVIVDDHGNKYRLDRDFTIGKFILRPRM